MSNLLPELLIVDDSSIDLTILKEMLGNNYQFNEAENGAKAVELCLSGSCSPSVILLDVSMPKLNGYETCIQIKEILGFEHVEVIFISGNDSIEENNMATKRVDLTTLLSPLIQKSCGKKCVLR